MNNKKMNEKGNVVLVAVLLILLCVCIILAVIFFKNTDEPINGGEVNSGDNHEIEKVEHDPIRMEAYRNALRKMIADKKLIDDEELFEDEFFKISNNKFAVCDVDFDGKEELLVSIGSAPTAGMVAVLYDYNEASGEVVKEFSSYVDVTFYDNGILKVSASHNQGLAGDSLWPYTLYKYNKQTDTYDLIAYVDAWDKNISGKNSDGESFPEEVDTDNVGVVYYIMENGYDLQSATSISKSDYEAWVKSYLNGAKEITLAYYDLTEEYINDFD